MSKKEEARAQNIEPIHKASKGSISWAHLEKQGLKILSPYNREDKMGGMMRLINEIEKK
jgi:hypothetical protein